MESQRVSFLLEGFLRGWLTFDYKNPKNKLREEMILNHLQKQEIKEVFKVKAQVDAALASGFPHSKEALKNAANSYQLYSELALPWLENKGKLNKKPTTREDFDGIRAILAEKRKKMEEAQKISKAEAK